MAGMESGSAVVPVPGGTKGRAGPGEQAGPATTQKRGGSLALAFSCIGHLYAHLFPNLIFTAGLALYSDLGMSKGDVLELAAPAMTLYGLAALPAGWLSKRFGAMPLMVAYFFGLGLGAVIAGLATSPWGLALGVGVIGLAGSIYHPVGIAWLIGNSPVEQRGRMLGINGLFGSLGLGSASVVAGTLTDYWDWSMAFLIPGAAALLTGLGLALAWRSGRVADAVADRTPEPTPDRRDTKRVFLILAIAMTCGGLAHLTLSATMPGLLEETLPGWFLTPLSDWTSGEVGAVGLIVAVIFALGTLGNIVGGPVADRFSLRRAYTVFWILQVPLLLLLAAGDGVPLVLWLSAIMFMQTGLLPIENSLVARYTPRDWLSVALGAKFVLAFGVSSAGVWLAGHLHDQTGSHALSYTLLAGLLTMVVALSLFLPKERR